VRGRPLPFVRYIESNQLPPDHYYAAYPRATATEVASALRVAERFDREILPARSLDDAQFAASWRRFIDAVQRDL
jgi:hypothetical protein